MAAVLSSGRVDSATYGLSASSSLAKRRRLDATVAAIRATAAVKPASELARTLSKDRLPSGLLAIDTLLDGGLARGKISEVIGRHGAGKTSLAACFTAAAVQHGEIAAWIDSSGAFDPASLRQTGVILSRVLWINPATTAGRVSYRYLDSAKFEHDDAPVSDAGCPPYPHTERIAQRSREGSRLPAFVVRQWRAAELVLKAGGFGLLVLDLGSYSGMVSRVAALRLARLAEYGATAVLILAQRRVCGSFTAVSLALKSAPRFSRFSRLGAHAPVLFDGLRIEARLARNKLGAPGRSTTWDALAVLPARAASPVLSSPRPIALARAISG